MLFFLANFQLRAAVPIGSQTGMLSNEYLK
jgi:hypothetical protein